MHKAKCIWDAKSVLGESPLWVEAEQALYWVDVKAPAIHRYTPSSKNKSSWPLREYIGCLVRRENGDFLAALQSGFVNIKFGPPGKIPTIVPIFNPEADMSNNRFNDGKLDATGRFIAGTMDNLEEDTSGTWWQLDLDNHVRKLDEGYKVTNGPAFDVARNRIYLTDSSAQTIFTADYTYAGAIKNKQVFLQFCDGDGYPDGMTTDKGGNLWVAFWDGHCIRKFSPEGKKVLDIPMPVPRPTSLAFNTKKTVLYITSASIGLNKDELKEAPLSGGLFTLNLPVN